ncbi:MAG: hypothetical protein K6B28_12825 [Lachnospiraceae bacterium]|nr:hypothetical protein [Lachnospiraceae bacterium]
MKDDKSNDWMAMQLWEEEKAFRRVAKMFGIRYVPKYDEQNRPGSGKISSGGHKDSYSKKLLKQWRENSDANALRQEHQDNCDAKKIRDEHSQSCDAEMIDRATGQ